jgi:hypothetical protein
MISRKDPMIERYFFATDRTENTENTGSCSAKSPDFVAICSKSPDFEKLLSYLREVRNLLQMFYRKLISFIIPASVFHSIIVASQSVHR